MESNNLQIACPNCGHHFSPEAALEGHLRVHLEKEYAEKNAASAKIAEERAKGTAQREFQAQIEALEKDSLLKSQKLQELEKKTMSLALREKELKEKEERADIDIRKRLLDQEEEIRNEAEKFALEKVSLEFQEKEAMFKRKQESLEVSIKKEAILEIEKAREEERMKYNELQKKYDDQSRLAEVMQRNAAQGSMQLQGEVQELAIEEYLRNAFPKDDIEEICKGVRGADCVHTVKDNFENVCGRILYESKRTKSFSKDWITKLKDDVRLKGANLGVSLEQVKQQFIGPAAASTICKKYQLSEDTLVGLAYDTLFKQLCGEGKLQTAEDKQVLAPLVY